MSRRVKGLVRKWLGTWLGRSSTADIPSGQHEERCANVPLPTMLPPHTKTLRRKPLQTPSARINPRRPLSPLFPFWLGIG